MSKDGIEELGDNSAKQLAGFIERIESLEAEKAEAADKIKAEKAVAKSAGFDVKAINQLLKDRKGDMEKTTELRSVVNTYRKALAKFDDTELGQWASAFETAQNTASASRTNVVSIKGKGRSNEPLN